jgi:hypothetical protein
MYTNDAHIFEDHPKEEHEISLQTRILDSVYKSLKGFTEVSWRIFLI